MNATCEPVMVYVPNQMKQELECGGDNCAAQHTPIFMVCIGLYLTNFKIAKVKNRTVT
jgi:hypothetical protein